MINTLLKKMIFAAIFCVALSTFAKAEPTMCNNNGQDVKVPFVKNVAQTLSFDDVIFASCQPSPNHVDMTYVVLLKLAHNYENCTKNCHYDIAFALAGSKTGKVTKQFMQKNAIIESNAKLSSVLIDDMLYQLSPNQRATAIQTRFEKATPTLLETGTDLYFLIERQNEFKAGLGNIASPDDLELTKLVMDKTIVHKRSNGQCYSYKMVLQRKINLGRYYNGFRALEINTTINDKIAKWDNNSCLETPITTTTSATTVPFNGTVYFIPQWISH